MEEESWRWLEGYVKDNYALEYDGIVDERPLDAAMDMYLSGMANWEVVRVMAMIWNAGFDAANREGA